MTVQIYTFKPSSTACTACASRPLYSLNAPSRPHDNCKCTIDYFLADVVLMSTTETLMLPSNSMEVTIAFVTPNDCLEESYTVSSSEETGWEISVGYKGVGGKLGQKGKEGITVTRKQKFCHGELCERTEEIYGIYEVKSYIIESKFMGFGTFFGPSGFTFIEYGFRSETELIDLKTRCK